MFIAIAQKIKYFFVPSIKMNIVVITLVIQNLIIAIHSQIFFDFMSMSDDDDEYSDENAFSFYEEVPVDPNFEYRMCSNDFEREKLFNERAWQYIVENTSENIDLEELSETEFDELRTRLEEWLEPTASYISESEEEYKRFKFNDINVCNNVTDEELQKIIAFYYYKEVEVINELDSYS